METSATISKCGQYRYELRRMWDTAKPVVLFIGLNPSTADAITDDNTSRVCINYAQRWGYGGLLVGNLFAHRSTDPAVLLTCVDPVGPENDTWLAQLQEEASLVVCAWGGNGAYQGRGNAVLAQLRNPHCLTTLKNGQPGHPLYKSADLRPVPYER